MRNVFLPTCLLALLLLAPTRTIKAQDVNAGFHAALLIPQSDFRNTIDALGGGFTVYGLYHIPRSPVAVGLDLGFANFGTDFRVEPLSSTIPDLTVRVDNNYNLLQAAFKFRLQPPRGPVRPYVDALMGVNYFFTETTISDRRSDISDPYMSDTNFEDHAFTFGGGTGVMFRVFNRRLGPNSPRGGYVTLGMRYMFGGEAEYLKKGSVKVNNGSVTYDVFNSRTDMAIVHLGMTLRF